MQVQSNKMSDVCPLYIKLIIHLPDKSKKNYQTKLNSDSTYDELLEFCCNKAEIPSPVFLVNQKILLEYHEGTEYFIVDDSSTWEVCCERSKANVFWVFYF